MQQKSLESWSALRVLLIAAQMAYNITNKKCHKKNKKCPKKTEQIRKDDNYLGHDESLVPNAPWTLWQRCLLRRVAADEILDLLGELAAQMHSKQMYVQLLIYIANVAALKKNITTCVSSNIGNVYVAPGSKSMQPMGPPAQQ